MVVFECGNCSETLKKPSVQKHLNGRCWGASMVCIDCSKVFFADEWAKHTSCISEEKKYQGALYNEKGDKAPKGKAKQDAWTSGLEKAVEMCTNAKVKGYIQKLSAFDNVPRKQKPFVNFVKNSVGIWDASTATQVWDAIATAQETLKKEEAAANNASGNGTSGNGSGNNNGNVAGKKRRWQGWEEEAKAALENHGTSECVECDDGESGGESGSKGKKSLSFEELQKFVSERYLEQSKLGFVKKRKIGEVKDSMLAAVPDSWLSDKDDRVRLVV